MPLAERKATVDWQGNLTEGSGVITEVSSGTLNNFGVTWASRTVSPDGRTSPEELIAAAHASCYAMAFSNTLNKNGTPPESLHVEANCILDRVEGGVKITTIQLSVKGRVPGLSDEQFKEIAKQGEQGCPVSNALRGGVNIELDAQLES